MPIYFLLVNLGASVAILNDNSIQSFSML